MQSALDFPRDILAGVKRELNRQAGGREGERFSLLYVRAFSLSPLLPADHFLSPPLASIAYPHAHTSDRDCNDDSSGLN